MLTVGSRVRVKQYSRTKTIFVNAEASPGTTTTYQGGWTGTVTNIFDGGGDDIVEVHRDGSGPEDGWYELAPDELEVI
jgi:putative protein kinase ArgK-like GTPase of G3E family